MIIRGMGAIRLVLMIILFTIFYYCNADASTMTVSDVDLQNSTLATEINQDKRKRIRRRFNRKHNVKKSKCQKVYRIKVR